MKQKACRIEWAGLPVPALARKLAQAAVDAALARDGLRKRLLCVLIVDDVENSRLHREHFGDATPTDVMSFPDGMPDPDSGCIRMGDLAVGLDVARRMADERGRPIEEEIALYVLHGALHLLGFDDIEDADRTDMWAVQRAVMSGLGIAID
jgi:probable rRNA maturation factor